jgi:hypothetical protein
VAALSDVVKDPVKRRAVVDDCTALIDAEVGDKRGLTGAAIKAAYMTVKNIKPGFIGSAMNDLLDPFSQKVDPFWADCQAKKANARQFFTLKKAEIANALLGITDARAERSQHKVLVKAYHRLRPQAVSHIGDAMPRLADLIAKHAS